MLPKTHWSFVLAAVALITMFRVTIQNPVKTFHISIFKADWFKAGEYCNSIGMQLATVQSQAENSALVTFIQNTDKFNSTFCEFWLGGSDLAEEGKFTWMPTGESIEFENWSANEPNGIERKDSRESDEDCLQLVYYPAKRHSWTWNDNLCTRKFYFICETVDRDCVKPFK